MVEWKYDDMAEINYLTSKLDVHERNVFDMQPLLRSERNRCVNKMHPNNGIY